ncbi:MAG TPA: hypothetical protein VF041_13570 [Gemmatimonadaceae bacterium]
MSRTQRMVLLGVPAVLLLAVAIFHPRAERPVQSVVLAAAGLGGAFALSHAVIGLAARKIGWLEAAGGIVLAAGLFLLGARYLPLAGERAQALTTAATALIIAGLAMQVRAFASR